MLELPEFLRFRWTADGLFTYYRQDDLLTGGESIGSLYRGPLSKGNLSVRIIFDGIRVQSLPGRGDGESPKWRTRLP